MATRRPRQPYHDTISSVRKGTTSQELVGSRIAELKQLQNAFSFYSRKNHTRNTYFPTKVFTNFTLDQGGGKFTRPDVRANGWLYKAKSLPENLFINL